MKRDIKVGDHMTCDMNFVAKTLADKPDGFIAGVASTPATDAYGHKVMAHAFDDLIKRKGLKGPKGIQLYAYHDHQKPAGIIKRLETVDKNLEIEAQLNLNVSYVKDLYEIAKQREGMNFSVGFYVEDYELVDDADVSKEMDDAWLLIKQGELHEVSIVTIPACSDAEMTFIKTVDTMTDFERALVAEGICHSRSQAHKLTMWAKKNVHLLQPKPPLLEDDGKPAAHPLLDAHQLRPAFDQIAKVKALLAARAR